MFSICLNFYRILFSLIAASIICTSALGQEGFIRSKEGKPVLNRWQLVSNCLRSLNKSRSDKTALAICECQIDKLDRYFTNKQYKKYTSKNVIDVTSLIKQDSIFEKEIEYCYTSSGKTVLLQAEGFGEEFISNCVKNIQKNAERQTDISRVTNFCKCQLELIKEKKISDVDIEAFNDPNSLLYYEIIYKCGDPFTDKKSAQLNWNQSFANDIQGPLTDTIKILTVNGMAYVKMTIGNKMQVWLYDTGASDLLINKELEDDLKKQNILSDSNYLGIEEYEMANGMIDTCRKYKINHVKLGKFMVSNVIIAVTDKGKRVIIGKGLLNKFSEWSLNNRENTLILIK